MVIALSSHVEQFILHFSLLLLLLGSIGFLVAKKWPRTGWLSALAIVGLLALKGRHFIPRSDWPAESRTAVWQMFATLVGAGAVALCLIFLDARRRSRLVRHN